jgi:hypothetical protein
MFYSAPPHLCTADDPWKEGLGKAIHPDAKLLYTDDAHSLDTAERYQCPHCDKRFWVELPN